MKINLIRLFLISLCFIVSCESVREEIYLNEDGSGSYTMYTDMIGSTRKMMTDMMQSVYADLDEDSLTRLVEENIWKDFPAEVDSLIDFESQLPDSIKEDPEKMKIVQAAKVFMKGSKKDGYMNVGTTFEFGSLDELEAFQDMMAENQSSPAGPGAQGFDAPKLKVDYDFDGKTFSRKSQPIGEAESFSDSTLAAIRLMLGESKTRTIIHLPKTVKKASKEQLISSEGRKVVYEYSLVESIIGEQSTDFEVEIKK